MKLKCCFFQFTKKVVSKTLNAELNLNILAYNAQLQNPEEVRDRVFNNLSQVAIEQNWFDTGLYPPLHLVRE